MPLADIEPIRFAPPTDGPECIEEDCWRAPYDEGGRCKRHADLHAYAVATKARHDRKAAV